jgi:metacaspase-1
MASIRAVLVGVDTYERADVPVLRGCVNDVILVRRLLKEGFGVPNEEIRVVVNARATKAAILHRLRVTMAAARPGDVVVFYFSGHGSQVRDRDGDELSDSLDEVICPYDMDWDRRTYILDDELDAIFDTVGEGVLIEAFFDCCFWGAGQLELVAEPEPRALRPGVRHLPPPVDIAARSEGEEEWLAYHRLTGSGSLADRHVAWGASREGSEAAEGYFEGRAHGVFTYWGCRAIADHLGRIRRFEYSRIQLLRDVRSVLHELGYVQRPELSAPGELGAGEPFVPGAEWGAWVERGWADRPTRRG